jgi:hypothetical protein
MFYIELHWIHQNTWKTVVCCLFRGSGINTFRMASSSSSPAEKSCACAYIAFLAEIFSWYADRKWPHYQSFDLICCNLKDRTLRTKDGIRKWTMNTRKRKDSRVLCCMPCSHAGGCRRCRGSPWDINISHLFSGSHSTLNYWKNCLFVSYWSYKWIFEIADTGTFICVKKGKAVPLHATQALGGRGGI